MRLDGCGLVVDAGRRVVDEAAVGVSWVTEAGLPAEAGAGAWAESVIGGK